MQQLLVVVNITDCASFLCGKNYDSDVFSVVSYNSFIHFLYDWFLEHVKMHFTQNGWAVTEVLSRNGLALRGLRRPERRMGALSS
jgi:hypothetical protein